MQKETDIWQKQKQNLPLDFIRRVENKADIGMPDVFYMHDTYAGFIENKISDNFPKSIKFQKTQPIWLDKYWRAGGECHVFLYVKNENFIYIWSGKDAFQLDKPFDIFDIPPILKVRPTKKGWKSIYEYLTGQ